MVLRMLTFPPSLIKQLLSAAARAFGQRARRLSHWRSHRRELAHSLLRRSAMTDESYFAMLIWTISVLMFACSVVALTQHPDWFGA
jgi:hypothetical protein